MASRQYRLPVSIALPAGSDAPRLRGKVADILRNPLVTVRLQVDIPGGKASFDDKQRPASPLTAWLFTTAASDLEARATKAKVERLLSEMRGLLAVELPGVTWTVGDPKAI